jgi:hypothetical protein
MAGAVQDDDPEEPRPVGPPMTPREQRIEGAVEEAIARGDFDDLPGAGKPLDLPDTHDPDWWIKQRIADDDVDRDALLPPVMLLRKEYERLDETLVELLDEDAVRAYAEDYSSRVMRDRLVSPQNQQIALTLDADDAVARWHRVRAAAGRDDATQSTTDDAQQDAGDEQESATARRPRRRRWFRRRP